MSDRKNKPKKFKKRGQESSSSSSSSSSESTSSLSSDDESNARDLKPIKEYLADRKELARQLFIAVKGDKLRMMLPQDLKKMESNELEEWCANELSGMSKARILSILNGQPMLQSSDSNDTDDSGPSLEIISDTEEWGDVSDAETTAREEELSSKKTLGLKKDKAKSKIRSERGNKEREKARSKSLKGKIKTETDPKPPKSSDVVKVKKETEAGEQSKEKDGESLLDLLELEMRARAIRALIRKEEDIIPATLSASPAPQSSHSNPNSTATVNSKTRARDRQLSLKVVQDKLQELDSSFNKNVNKNAAGEEEDEEEDVVLVLQPTTTIELLSSESDNEGGQGKRRNQKFENERILGNGAAGIVRDSNSSKGKLDEAKNPAAEGEAVANGSEKTSSADAIAPLGQKNLNPEEEKGVEKSPKRVATDLEMFRMLKKKAQQKGGEENAPIPEKNGGEQTAVAKNSAEPIPEPEAESLLDLPTTADSKEEKNEIQDVKPPRLEEEKQVEKKLETNETPEVDEDKSTDLEIIIDLDDYPDDMEDLDSGEKKKKVSDSNSKSDSAKTGEENSGKAAETWATRYYQTEDVQNVIKESKIQSEIRKRLRERQRLARLSNSPNLNPAQSSVSTTTSVAEKSGGEKEDGSTTGSVEEYLALKNVEGVSPSLDPGTVDHRNEFGAGKIAESILSTVETDLVKTDSTLIIGVESVADTGGVMDKIQ